MSSMNLFSKNFEVIVGTYENFMIAFTIKYAEVSSILLLSFIVDQKYEIYYGYLFSPSSIVI